MDEFATESLETPAPEPLRPVLTSVAISAVFHVLLFTTVTHFAPLSPSVSSRFSEQNEPKILHVRLADDPFVRADPSGTVVDVMDDKPSEKSPPLNARFLSDKNRSVEQEMQAQVTGPNPTSAVGSPGQAGGGSTPPPSGEGLSGFSLSPRVGEGVGGTGFSASLAPSNYLPEIAFGNQTLLNTAEFRFSSYYVRLKRQIEPIWDPRPVLYRTRDLRERYITQVEILLDARGYVKDVRVTQPSGVQGLDYEAVRAVREASPYLNPPDGIVQPDGDIHLGPFQFIVTRNSVF